MISLLLGWFGFVAFISLLPELTQSQYFLYSSCMLSFNCVYNSIYFVNISQKIAVLIATVPNILFLYVIIVYNDFLSFTPMKHETLLGLFFFYLYVSLYYIKIGQKQP